MPYPTPYDVPDEARKMALYQSLLGMGSQMLQPKPYKSGLMGDIGNVFGAANQGMSNMGSLLGNYQKTLQEQEAMKLKQAEDMRQQQQLEAQIPLIQAQTQNQLRQASPEQTVPFNGMNVPLSKFSSLLGAVTGAQEQTRKAAESRDTGIGMQNLGILQNLPANIGGMSPGDAATAEGNIREQAMRYAPKETQDYLKGMKPEKPNTLESVVKDAASPTGYSKVDNMGNKIKGVPAPHEGKQPDDITDITESYNKAVESINKQFDDQTIRIEGNIYLSDDKKNTMKDGAVKEQNRRINEVVNRFEPLFKKRGWTLKSQQPEKAAPQQQGQQGATVKTKSGRPAYYGEDGRLYYAD